MKTTLRVLLTLAFLFVVTTGVWATPVIFTPDVSASSVNVSDDAQYGNLKGILVLAATSFTLADNSTQIIDFFTLTASGLALNKDYTVEATLAFSAPAIVGTGTGGGKFSTICGLISGGTLTWDTNSVPDYFTLADGNEIKIDFQNGSALVLGSAVTVHAYVTNLGGATAIPEPTTILLLGFGLVGLAGIRRKLKK